MEGSLFRWISLALILFRLCYNFTFTKKLLNFSPSFLYLYYPDMLYHVATATAVLKGCVVSILIPLKKRIDCWGCFSLVNSCSVVVGTIYWDLYTPKYRW